VPAPTGGARPDIVVILTDEERAVPPYESPEVQRWRDRVLTGRSWFHEHGVRFDRHYTGSLACVPSRPTLFTGQYPDVHGVTQTDGLGKVADDSRMRWLRAGEVPTLGHWFRAGGYDTHYDGKWHITHADLHDPETGERTPTNDDDGNVLAEGVQAYRDADPLDEFGFSGWVGPEPHGAALADCGTVRDPLIADRVVAWLEDRYRRRRNGDADALRPFLLVASFINPHDIVLFPAWQRSSPIDPSPLDPPPVPEAPTAHEDLKDKPAAQIAYREAYYSGYGPAPAVEAMYRRNAQRYRDLYYRLHLEVDTPLDRVRRAVTEGGSDRAVLVRSSDHGDLLGAHGGLHQKWFNLYDEATRVPFSIVCTGEAATPGGRSVTTPTSHLDLVPTLLSAAGLDEAGLAAELRRRFSEVHPLPGRDLMGLVRSGGATGPAERSRAVYLMTRDNMLEGDSGASGLARRLGLADHAVGPLAISVPAFVGANFEGVVAVVDDVDADGGGGHLWKLARTFDDPDTWTEPGRRHLAADGPGGPEYRRTPLPDDWELYDLDADPVEAHNRWADAAAAAVRDRLVQRLTDERTRCVPGRNTPWPYADRHPIGGPMSKKPPPPARWLRRAVQKVGMHPDDTAAFTGSLRGRRALVVATNHGTLSIGKATGVYSSEMTVPYYAFLDAGMTVDVASPRGGTIPVDPQSLNPVLRSDADDRFLADDELMAKVTDSLPIAGLDMADYDIVYLAGGWGAAFDFGTSQALADKMTEANAEGLVMGGVCHGPLGLRNATGTDGRPLVEGRRMTAVTDKQVRELKIESTPQHPETELRSKGARFESVTRFRDPFANHWVVDGNLVTGQNQNAGPMVAREMMQLVADRAAARPDAGPMPPTDRSAVEQEV
jgi:arylsulfatase A-like enzyme/putative intracellular protease/amidase